MKIALCIYGQPRSYEKGYEYIYKNLLSKYDVDVYLQTWYYDFFDYNKLIDLYKPKKIKIETQLDLPYERYVRYSKYNVYISFYGQKSVNQLLDQHYDWVVSTRYDFALNFTPDFKSSDNNCIYILPSLRSDIVNYGLYYSSLENTTLVSNCYDNINTLLTLGVEDTGECLCAGNIKYYNKEIKFVDENPPFLPDQYGCMAHSVIRDDFEFWKDK